MRTFLSTHWKSIVVLIVLVVLAVLTMSPGSAHVDPGTRHCGYMAALARQYPASPG